MKDPRNPFRLRASEHIENDSAFLRFFEPTMLDLLPKGDASTKVHIIRSAAGGGKTSLLRLFTPGVLLALHASRGREDCKELFQRVAQMGFIDETGPQLLAVNISFSQEYAALTDIGIDSARMVRLLFGLLNARIVLSAIRGALMLAKLEYPQDLDRLSIQADPSVADQLGFSLPLRGTVLYEWARRHESDVCDALGGPDSQVEGTLGHRSLLALGLIHPTAITIDGVPVAKHVLVAFDNGQDIAPKQREALLQHLLNLRSPVGVWFAERFEAMGTDEHLMSGALAGRDYHDVVLLEQFWRDKRSRFQKVLFNIADRRSRDAAAEINSFSSCLEPSLDGPKEQDRISAALQVVEQRVRAITKHFRTYDNWIVERDAMQATSWEKLVAWRSMEILIERDRRKSQKTLEFVDLTASELKNQDGSDVQSAAKMFLAKEFKLPYYYGPECLAGLASSNIEQFLWLAGDLFEEVAAADVLKRMAQLSPTRQDAIIRAAVNSWWNEIPRRMRNGREVMRLMNSIGEFAKDVSYQANAPYSPGVTGIAISMSEFEKLRNGDSRHANTKDELKGILSIAIAHNLLEAIPDYSVKNAKWLVLYLNRALCVQFRLPWQYGGFREKKLAELRQWMAGGYKPVKGQLL